MPASSALAEELSRFIRAAQAERRLPSVSAAVFRGPEVLWADAVGLADVEQAVEATPDTQYRVGSITKTFTAAAVLQLRDAGELELEDRLAEHVPEAPQRGPTLRTMLAHVSGLQREAPGDYWETLEFPSREQALATLGEVEQVLRPGEHWHYSNLAFGLLGEVVARRSGMAYERYVEDRLLAPVGLERTTWNPMPPAANGYYVEPYADVVKREPNVDLRGGAAAGQLWSTTGDLARWAAFLGDPDPTVLAPETAAEMHAFQAMADLEGWKLGWGLGLMLFRAGGRIFAGHSGGMNGFVANLARERAGRVGAAVLVNSHVGISVEELGVELAVKAVEAIPPQPVEWRPEGAPPTEAEGVLGRWWSEGREFVFSYRSGRLEARGAADPRERAPAVFAPEGRDVFRTVSGRERGELLRVVRDDAGAVVKLYWAGYPFLRSPGAF